MTSPYGSRPGTRRLRSKLPLEDCMPQAMKAWFYSALQAWFYSDLQAWFYSALQAWFYSDLQAWFYSDLQAWFYSDLPGKPQRSKQVCEMGAELEEELRQQSPGIAGGRSRTRPGWRTEQDQAQAGGQSRTRPGWRTEQDQARLEDGAGPGQAGGRSRTRPGWRTEQDQARLEATICHQGMTGPSSL
ncbi:unnamed protein product [Arctogadus glacialis]